MRKSSLLIFTFLIAPLFVVAQFSYGVSGGVTINHFAFSDSKEEFKDLYSTNTGFTAGIITQLDIGKNFKLSPELHFTQRGASISFVFNGMNNEFKYNLNYLELPILITYSIKKLSFDLGPDFAYKFSAIAKSKTNSGNLDSIFDRKIDGGVILGLRFEVIQHLFIISRYYYGIVPVTEMILADVNNNQTKAQVRNRSFQFSLAYKMK